jgi:hypothetical protein
MVGSGPNATGEINRMLADYGWLSWIIIGFLAGGIAKLLMPGKDPGRLHHHHPAGDRRRDGGRLPRPGARLV